MRISMLALSLLAIVASAHGQTRAQFDALQSQVATLQKQVAALQANKALALAPFVSVDLNPQLGVPGPNITFKGANIHIVNGLGVTGSSSYSSNGLGNLIVGYDEVPSAAPDRPNGRINRRRLYFETAPII
jgi:hypothetical protein